MMDILIERYPSFFGPHAFITAYPTTDGNTGFMVDTSQFSTIFGDPAFGHNKVLVFLTWAIFGQIVY